MKEELKSLKKAGIKTVFLNGWKETIDYVLTLSNVKKISDNHYETFE